jgi:hypothetical protein
MKTGIRFLLALVATTMFASCKDKKCDINMSLSGKWKQVEVAAGQVLVGYEVNYNGSEGKLLNVTANAYKYVNGDVAWKDVLAESNAIFDVNVLTRSLSGTASYSRWKCAVLSGGNEIAFTRPGNSTDVYQRWVKVE